MVLLRSLGLPLLAFPLVALATNSTRNADLQSRFRTKSAFLHAQGGESKQVALAPSESDDGVLPHDDQVPVRPGKPPAKVKKAAAEVKKAAAKVKKMEPLEDVPRAPPGLMLGIFGALSLAGILACSMLWNRYAFPEEADEAEDGSDEDQAMGKRDSIFSMGRQTSMKSEGVFGREEFEQIAEHGGLDFYTCMALSLGREKSLGATLRFLPRFTILFFMQFLLGVLIITYQTSNQDQHYFPTTQGHVYRTIGTILFAYSAWTLNASMHDECRKGLIYDMSKRSVSGWYGVPILMGEVSSTFVACSLMVTLFFVFCVTPQPEELLIKSVAINFVAEIDSLLVDKDMKLQAIDDLNFFLSEWRSGTRASVVERSMGSLTDFASIGSMRSSQIAGLTVPSPKSPEEQKLWTDLMFFGSLRLNKLFRMVVPSMGIILTFLFAFMHDEVMCRQLRKVEPWPFCVGLEH